MGYFDDNEDRIVYGRRRPRLFDEDVDIEDEPRQPRCKKCGNTDVRWRQQGGKWVLFSLQPGVVHTCELKTDDFPDLA